MEDNRKTKWSLFSDTSWFDGKGTNIPFGNHEQNSFGEVWPSDFCSRSDVSNIDNSEHIVAFFGDSFVYGHGLGYKDSLEHILSNELHKNDNTTFVNFGTPGFSNQAIVRTLEQWTNEKKYIEKTKAIFFNLSPISRMHYAVAPTYVHHDSRMPREQKKVIYNENYDYRAWLLDFTSNRPDPAPGNPEAIKILKHAYTQYFLHFDTPIMNIINGFEVPIRRIYWIGKALGIPMYYHINEHIFDTYNLDDVSYILECLNSISNDGKFERVDFEFDETNYLPCGHWNQRGNRILADVLYSRIKKHLE